MLEVANARGRQDVARGMLGNSVVKIELVESKRKESRTAGEGVYLS